MTHCLDTIFAACEWVSLKGKGSRDACKVSTAVKWADWDKKIFSPAMCVLWWGETRRNEDGYDTFWIPQPEAWHGKVAKHLNMSEEWVKAFVEQCHRGNASSRWTLEVTFEGERDYHLVNPKIDLRQEKINEELFPETVACLQAYSPQQSLAKVPYWTKNPPVDLYRSKLLGAVYDLYSATEASKNI
jgi:hypothetical protein